MDNICFFIIMIICIGVVFCSLDKKSEGKREYERFMSFLERAEKEKMDDGRSLIILIDKNRAQKIVDYGLDPSKYIDGLIDVDMAKREADSQ